MFESYASYKMYNIKKGKKSNIGTRSLTSV